MRVDISLLPALAATFMLVFARIGAMVMLLRGLGEVNIPARMKLSIALLLTLIILPLHPQAYRVALSSLAQLMRLMHVYFVGVPPSIIVGFLILALVISAIMGTFLDYFVSVMHELTPLR